MAAAAGKAVLTVIEDEKLQENAENVGNYILTGLKEMQKEFPLLSDVRGHGLFIGVELLDENKKPDEALAYHIRFINYMIHTEINETRFVKIFFLFTYASVLKV